jgi:3',5'-cyclic AMP phosphodiesterase CpdA
VRADAGASWAEAGPTSSRRYAPAGIEPRRLVRATIAGLEPGAEFSYRVLRGGTPAFEARARARAGPGRPHRFVAFGDGGIEGDASRAVARRAMLERPDFVMIAGDLAYYKGRLADYLDKVFPTYNDDALSPSSGAPLLRSAFTLVAPGNHDLLERDLDVYPDALFYYLAWSLPLNGPLAVPGFAHTPALRGAEARRRAFLDAAGPAYPRMANYSFDFGDAHWTVLDTNPYVDWTDPALRDWLARDLEAARGASWRFVAFHQPPFHSSRVHADEQATRLLAGLFEEHGVDLVLCGHIHNYQRSYPIRFAAAPGPGGRMVDAEGHVTGRWTIDRSFDGRTRTRPDGVIYLVTGAGGARLYDPDQTDAPSSWQPFTARLVSDVHSLTVVDVDATRLLVRQLSADGDELDRFVVTR